MRGKNCHKNSGSVLGFLTRWGSRSDDELSKSVLVEISESEKFGQETHFKGGLGENKNIEKLTAPVDFGLE